MCEPVAVILDGEQYTALKKIIQQIYPIEHMYYDAKYGPFEDVQEAALKGKTGHIFESIAVIWDKIEYEEDGE